MHQSLVNTIVKIVEGHDPWFKLRMSASEEISVSPLLECDAALRVLACGSSTNTIDHYVRIGKDTILKAVRRFTKP